LAQATAASESDPEREGLLPAAIGQGVFTPWYTDDVSLRVLRHLPPDRRDAIDGLADVGGRVEQAYAARVRLVDGEVQLITSTPREELAPLVKEPAR
jgi:hypothetical protein